MPLSSHTQFKFYKMQHPQSIFSTTSVNVYISTALAKAKLAAQQKAATYAAERSKKLAGKRKKGEEEEEGEVDPSPAKKAKKSPVATKTPSPAPPAKTKAVVVKNEPTPRSSSRSKMKFPLYFNISIVTHGTTT